MISISMADLSQQPMQPEAFEQAADSTPRPALQQGAQPSSGYPGQGMLAAQQQLQNLLVLLQERIEAPITTAPRVASRLAQLAQVAMPGGVLFEAGQPLAIPAHARARINSVRSRRL